MDAPVAIITGAGRGIGRATAQELNGRGYRVVLVSRTAGELAETAKLVGTSLVLAADVSRPEQAERIVAATLERFGRLDALVNNAGYAPALKLEETTTEQWDKVLAINLTAPFLLMRQAWPVFRKAGGGVIVNISSVAAREPYDVLTAYGAAKAALNLLTLAAARQGQPLNIRVHGVAPGATETSMFRQLLTEEQFPRANTLEPGDVARVVVQCICGDLRFSSGEIIYVQKTLAGD
jgi:NAD(P)-dependent dehydrogenase (short-subunit alcohol dehydrogenase family)